MSLDEDTPIDLPDEDDYSAVERSGKSLIGRLLNPDCQNMARMLRMMPRIWKVYERVKGIALTRESFQFIFDLETDIKTVMKQGIWDFDDWGVVMDRWVETPPANFLKTAPVWIRIHKIPVNYFTLKTIERIADRIGKVVTIEYDPEKSVLQAFVRVLVILDLEQPVRETKTVNLPRGGVETVEIKYERLVKKCFNCFRLTHEKAKCPLLLNQKNRGVSETLKRSEITQNGNLQRQHHNNLADQIMPYLIPSAPPGFAPRPNVVAPEVFDQMRIYMNSGDPNDRYIREMRMKQTLDDLSKDPVAQRSYLRLEAPPKVVGISESNAETIMSHDTNKMGPMRFQGTSLAESGGQPNSQRAHDTVNPNPVNTMVPGDQVTKGRTCVEEMVNTGIKQKDPPGNDKMDGVNMEGIVNFVPHCDNTGPDPVPNCELVFKIGTSTESSTGTNSRNKGSKQRNATWARKPRGSKAQNGSSQNETEVETEHGVEHTSKRKATAREGVSTKMSKQAEGLMVHQKPSNPQ
ncbi:uncharacterized protein LOC112084174 [Eutrema salsugineum]|uniref:uncharacterized protein LOC112084174 n=1 Tax=Eutrema salsugineum TaxID=72664 RepID=UPI000CED5193|nr:uncharacterized protein LOC112084174 [Eutrema salsugineum]